MFVCSTGVILKRYPEYAVFGLLGVVVAQGESCRIPTTISSVIIAWLEGSKRESADAVQVLDTASSSTSPSFSAT